MFKTNTVDWKQALHCRIRQKKVSEKGHAYGKQIRQKKKQKPRRLTENEMTVESRVIYCNSTNFRGEEAEGKKSSVCL